MPDKANAGIAASLRIRMRDDHADYPALVLVNHILGSRLFGRIREQEGFSYAVGSRFGLLRYRVELHDTGVLATAGSATATAVTPPASESPPRMLPPAVAS